MTAAPPSRQASVTAMRSLGGVALRLARQWWPHLVALAAACGIVAATIAGALGVGDSLTRGLRRLALARLGGIEAAVLSDGKELHVQLDPQRLSAPVALEHPEAAYELPFKDAKARLIDAFEREYWQRALDRHQWNVSAAARSSGLHRKSLEYLIKKLDLVRPA